MDANARRAALSRTQLFRELSPQDLDAVLAHAIVRRFGRGDPILHRGEPSTGMTVIESGRARVSVMSEEGTEVTLAILGPGEVLGEMSLLDGEECSADVTAQEDCVTLVVERSQFLRLLRGNNALCLHLLTMLSRRLRRSNAALEDMAVLALPERLGRLLLRLSRDYGATVRNGTRIEMKLSQKDLSALVGASREKVNRQLREWELGGVLGKDSGRLLILRPQELGAVD